MTGSWLPSLTKGFSVIKGTVSQDRGELLMVETDKAHFFNVAGDGF